MKRPGLDEELDLAIVGVGPPALVALLEAQRAGLRAVGIDKGPVCGALVRHPAYMRWFSTADKLQLDDFPLLIDEKNPSRREYLKYCRAFARHHRLPLATYHTVTAIERQDEMFHVHAEDLFGRPYTWRARNVAVGTGFYDSPRPLNVPGEDLPHVSHVYREAHYYADYDVVVIGAGSSAAEVALELWREGARVTVVMRGEEFNTKFWIKPDVENRIREESIRCYRNAEVLEIRPDEIEIRDAARRTATLACDFVLAMTGYSPDTSMLKAVGAEVDPVSNRPVLSEDLETTVPGLFVMGTLIAGVDSNVVFIENSRDHGAKIVGRIVRRRTAEPGRLSPGLTGGTDR
jgi:thioredoxin reductase (NADPH)